MVLEIIVWVDCCFIIMQLDIKEQSLILEGKKYSRKELMSLSANATGDNTSSFIGYTVFLQTGLVILLL